MLTEVKVNLATAIKRLRDRTGVTQAELAQKMGSSQSRIAKMERGEASYTGTLTPMPRLGGLPPMAALAPLQPIRRSQP